MTQRGVFLPQARRTHKLHVAIIVSLVSAASLVAQTTGAAPMGRHLALVLGNNLYSPPLSNAVNDATDMSQTLRQIGFTVTLGTDLKLAGMTTVIENFIGNTMANDYVVFYYSGHGMQVDGENYMLPIDFTLSDSATARFRAYPVSKALEALMARHTRANVFILDACRNNPFNSSRGGPLGLAAMAGIGTFIAFATGPGGVASDNPAEKNGLFTKAVLSNIQAPGIGLNELFERVRASVYKDSGGAQLPWVATSLIGSDLLQSSPLLASAPVPTPSAAAATPATRSPTSENDRPFVQSTPTGQQATIVPGSIMTTPNTAGVQMAPRSLPEVLTNDDDTWTAAAIAQIAAGDLQAADITVTNVLQIYVRDATATRMMGQVRLLQGRYPEALEFLNKAMELSPLDPQPLYFRSLSYALMSKYALALRDCEAALVRDPQSVDFLLVQANIFYVMGRLTDAIALCQNILAITPKSPAAYTIRGNCYLALGQNALAAADFTSAAQVQVEQ